MNLELVFYQKDNRIYRIYRPTATTEKLFETDQEITWFQPLSSTVILWNTYTPEGDAYMAEHGTFLDAPDIVMETGWLYNSVTGIQINDITSVLNAKGIIDYHIQKPQNKMWRCNHDR